MTGSSFWRRLSGTAISLFLYFSITADPARATIRYEVSLIPPEQHLFHVSMQIPDVKDEVIVQLAAWNALYQIRDFSAHVQRVEAFAGADTVNDLSVAFDYFHVQNGGASAEPVHGTRRKVTQAKGGRPRSQDTRPVLGRQSRIQRPARQTGHSKTTATLRRAASSRRP